MRKAIVPFLFSILLVSLIPNYAHASHPFLLTLNPTANDMANALNLPVTITSATYQGSTAAAGTFSIGNLQGLENGIILSTGKVVSVSPDIPGWVDPTQGTSFGLPGSTLIGNLPSHPLCPHTDVTNDAAVLTIEFDNPGDNEAISMKFIFGTEEYPEWICTTFNDRFGVFLNGQNIAFNQVGTIVGSNPDTFALVGTDHFTSPPENPTSFDALTVPLEITAPVAPNSHNTLQIAIADVGDTIYDSIVFIEGNPEPMNPMVDNDGDGHFTPTDCNDSDSTIYPGAPEVFDDGIDQDCDGVDQSNPDADFDGVLNNVDNCPTDPNPDQGDIENDGIGDACDPDYSFFSSLVLQIQSLLNRVEELEDRVEVLEGGKTKNFSQKECDNFEKIAQKQIDKGKEIPKGLREKLAICSVLYP